MKYLTSEKTDVPQPSKCASDIISKNGMFESRKAKKISGGIGHNTEERGMVASCL
jgi:hypothetical protein